MSKQGEPIRIGEQLAGARLFSILFREGMVLVQDTARYLDGPGREHAKGLQHRAALAYAAESMRLTTRLMQLASWLLLQRAVNEGEMSLAHASREKDKIKLAADEPTDRHTRKLLPEALGELIDRAVALQERVQRFDSSIHGRPDQSAKMSPVVAQLGLLKAAFERPPA